MPPLLRERQAALALIAFDLLREADDRQQEEEEEDMLLLVAMRHMNLLHTATAFAVKRAYTFRSPYYIKPRPSSFFENTVKPHYEEVDWLQHYRMHSATFYELLEGITPLLALQDTNFRQPVSAERRLSCALLYLASPVSMREKTRTRTVKLTTSRVFERTYPNNSIAGEAHVPCTTSRHPKGLAQSMSTAYTMAAAYEEQLASSRCSSNSGSDSGTYSPASPFGGMPAATIKNRHLAVALEGFERGGINDSFNSQLQEFASASSQLQDSEFAPGKPMKVWGNTLFDENGQSSPPLSPSRAVVRTAESIDSFDSAHSQGQLAVSAAPGPCISSMASMTSIRSIGSRRSPAPAEVPTASTSGWEGRVRHLMGSQQCEEAVRLPAPSGGNLVRCYIKREKGKLGGSGSYQMYLEAGNVPLLTAKKQSLSKSSVFSIASSSEALRKDSTCISKLKSNFTGTEFLLQGRASGSEELCIHFKANGLTVGPRTMSAVMPTPEAAWRPAEDGSLSTLMAQAKDRTLPAQLERDMAIVCSKPPEYDDASKCHTLAFKARKVQTSKKNMQLACWDHRNDRIGAELLLQMAKLTDDEYALDFAYPLSIHTAFAVALSNLDDKLCHKI